MLGFSQRWSKGRTKTRSEKSRPMSRAIVMHVIHSRWWQHWGVATTPKLWWTSL